MSLEEQALLFSRKLNGINLYFMYNTATVENSEVATQVTSSNSHGRPLQTMRCPSWTTRLGRLSLSENINKMMKMWPSSNLDKEAILPQNHANSQCCLKGNDNCCWVIFSSTGRGGWAQCPGDAQDAEGIRGSQAPIPSSQAGRALHVVLPSQVWKWDRPGTQDRTRKQIDPSKCAAENNKSNYCCPLMKHLASLFGASKLGRAQFDRRSLQAGAREVGVAPSSLNCSRSWNWIGRGCGGVAVPAIEDRWAPMPGVPCWQWTPMSTRCGSSSERCQSKKVMIGTQRGNVHMHMERMWKHGASWAEETDRMERRMTCRSAALATSRVSISFDANGNKRPLVSLFELGAQNARLPGIRQPPQPWVWLLSVPDSLRQLCTFSGTNVLRRSLQVPPLSDALCEQFSV